MPGKSSSFRALYEQELSYVCKSLKRLGVPAKDTEDLAQEVFVTAFQRFGTYDAARPLRPWLFGIAFRVASSFRNRAHHRTELVGELPELEDQAASPDETVAASQGRKLVLRALGALNLDRRAIFVLHEIDGVSVPEAAQALSIPVNTAYTRLRAARHDFTEQLRQLRREGGPA